MKNLYKVALLAALGLGGIATAQAQVQSGGGATYNQDLIIGFTSTTGNDTIYDLGSATSLTSGESWNLDSILSSYNLSTVNWGVIGSVTTGHSQYLTYALGTPPPVPSQGAWTPINTAVKTVYNGAFTTAGAGNAATVAATAPNSWNAETLNPTLGTDYINENVNPNTAGETSVNFYQAVDNNTTPTLLGDFSLASDGVVTYNVAAVPEPATYGMLAAGGLLVVALRNRFSKKQA